MAPGGRRPDGDSLDHTLIKFTYKWQPEALHQHHPLLPFPKDCHSFHLPTEGSGPSQPGHCSFVFCIMYGL